MSAIAGAFFLNDQFVAQTDLERMVERLAHRGPDGSGFWSRHGIGLGHTMLHTTPESLRERLPLVNATTGLAITADARIDNRDELAAALGISERRDDITDSELILRAYQAWGEGSPARLLGDFAFAIWDSRKQRLFCARDPMGVKPFYYYHSPHRVFAFASEIKALFCLADVPHHLNEVKVGDYLARFFDDRASTFYQDIFRLPAAHSLVVHTEGLHIQRYWAFDPSREIQLRSDDEYAEAFREIFTEAVRCRLRSAFPVGSTLSGGLDSSSVACTARNVLAQAGKGPLHVFSAIFPTLPEAILPMIDERPYMAAVLATGGFEPHQIHADRLSPLADYDKILWHMDEPIRAPNLYIHWTLYRAAHAQGNRVFLDGIDGDSTVSHGYAYLAELASTGHWWALAAEAAALSKRANASSYSPRWVMWEFGVRPLVPDAVVNLWRRLRGRPTPPLWPTDAMINPAFARRIGLAERIATSQGKTSRPPRTARESHWQNLTSALHQYALELADRASAAFALETRYPFFDRRLMEFCLALPPDQKIHNGWTRVVMRRAMTDILPPQVQWRTTKANLSPNFTLRLLEYERETLDKVIMGEPQRIAEYVDMSALRSTYRRYLSQTTQNSPDALALYSVAVLALWLRLSNLTGLSGQG